MRRRMIRSICFVAVSLFICASNHYSKAKRITQSGISFKETEFQTGDIILREGKGFLSAVFKSFSLKERKYSHTGFILKENGSYFVCHYIDGETTGFSKDKLKDFTVTSECRTFAVYRPAYSQLQKAGIQRMITDPLNSKVSFDDQFDLNNSNLYCTEWIYQCLEKSGFEMPLTKFNGMKYVAPDNLYINSFTKKIIAVDYESEI